MPRLGLGISWRHFRSGTCSSLRFLNRNGSFTLGDAKIKSWHDEWGCDSCERYVMVRPALAKILETIGDRPVIPLTGKQELARIVVLRLAPAQALHIKLLDHTASVHHRQPVAHIGDHGEVVA